MFFCFDLFYSVQFCFVDLSWMPLGDFSKLYSCMVFLKNLILFVLRFPVDLFGAVVSICHILIPLMVGKE